MFKKFCKENYKVLKFKLNLKENYSKENFKKVLKEIFLMKEKPLCFQNVENNYNDHSDASLYLNIFTFNYIYIY